MKFRFRKPSSPSTDLRSKRRRAARRAALTVDLLEQRQVLSAFGALHSLAGSTTSTSGSSTPNIFDFAHNAITQVGLSRQSATDAVQSEKTTVENANIDVVQSLESLKADLQAAQAQAAQQYLQDKADFYKPGQITDLSTLKAIRNEEGVITSIVKKDDSTLNNDERKLDGLEKSDDSKFDKEDKTLENDFNAAENDPEKTAQEENNITTEESQVDDSVSAGYDPVVIRVRKDMDNEQGIESTQGGRVNTLVTEAENLGNSNGGGMGGGGATGGGNGGGATGAGGGTSGGTGSGGSNGGSTGGGNGGGSTGGSTGGSNGGSNGGGSNGGGATSGQGQYTKYIYNLNQPSDGWFRAGIDGEIFTTKSNVLNAITTEEQQNQADNTDNEAFGYAQTTTEPPDGQVPAGVHIKLIYVPKGRNAPPVP